MCVCVCVCVCNGLFYLDGVRLLETDTSLQRDE
jgi:hypothetical protein